jgi:predicted ATPase/DNA-binding XRE family transcriptional regulator
MNPSSSFGRWLRQRRKALDLTQNDLACQVGCAVATIQKIEKDLRRPSKQITERLADVLAISPDERPAFVTFARRTVEPLQTLPVQRSSPAPPANLPVQPTPLAGRVNELAQIAERLADPACRLLTLVGPGGIGKTRLAIQAAVTCTDAFAQGVYFVALASVGSPDLLSSAIAGALTISFYGNEPPDVQIVNYLREMEMLLVMDNFEHLLDGVDLLTSLLAKCRRLKVLVTSRERLNVRAEWVLPIDGLPCPQIGEVGELDTYSSVQLFMQCARRIQPGFSLTDDPGAVIALCQAVEGMPLGIELAATWLRMMPCHQIAPQIQLDVDFLAAPLRDLPERQQSLRAVFDQSWRLLSEREQQVLEYLSVFRGGFGPEAAEAVAGATLRVLASLLDKSLIKIHPSGRYDVHERLRQYALGKLVESGLDADAAQRHLAHFLKLAQAAEPELIGAQQVDWLDRLEMEHDNSRAALSWSLSGGAAATGLQLAASLSLFWYMRCHWAEGRRWLAQALSAGPKASAPARPKALAFAAWFAFLGDHLQKAAEQAEEAVIPAQEAGDYWTVALALGIWGGATWHSDPVHAVARIEESREILRLSGLRKYMTFSLNRLAEIAIEQGNLERANVSYEEMLVISREIDNHDTMAWSLYKLGNMALIRGNTVQAQTFYGESLPIAEYVRNQRVIADILHGLGRVALAEGRYESANALVEASLAMHRSLGFKSQIAWILHSQGQLAQARNDLGQASARFAEALMLSQEQGLVMRVVQCIAGLLGVALAQNNFVQAATLSGALEAQADRRGHFAVWDKYTRDNYGRTSAIVHSLLGESGPAAAWAVGRAMALEQAIAYALEPTA